MFTDPLENYLANGLGKLFLQRDPSLTKRAYKIAHVLHQERQLCFICLMGSVWDRAASSHVDFCCPLCSYWSRSQLSGTGTGCERSTESSSLITSLMIQRAVHQKTAGPKVKSIYFQVGRKENHREVERCKRQRRIQADMKQHCIFQEQKAKQILLDLAFILSGDENQRVDEGGMQGAWSSLSALRNFQNIFLTTTIIIRIIIAFIKSP